MLKLLHIQKTLSDDSQYFFYFSFFKLFNTNAGYRHVACNIFTGIEHTKVQQADSVSFIRHNMSSSYQKEENKNFSMHCISGRLLSSVSFKKSFSLKVLIWTKEPNDLSVIPGRTFN